MNNQPAHGEILEAVNELRAELARLRGDVAPLVERGADLKEVVEVVRALHVGTKGMNWMAKLVASIVFLGGLIIGAKHLWNSAMNFFTNGG